MFDDALTSVQSTPPALVSQQHTWIDAHPLALLDGLAISIRDGTPYLDYRMGTRGSDRLLTLTLDQPVPYYGRNRTSNSGYWEFAPVACAALDHHAKQVGAWGPECKIEAVLKKPRGKLVLVPADGTHWPGSYLYTPRRPGRDEFKFILSNGAGKRVVVTYVLNAERFYPAP